MDNKGTFRLRVFYRKQGRLALLSHLEVARALERAIRRARLPYAISQGFSPHMKISFGAALPVGIGGLHECFDLQITRYIAPEKVCAALQAVSVEDLMILSCASLGSKEPAASVAFPLSVYEVVLSEALDAIQLPETIKVVRKKKEKVLVVDDFLTGPVQAKGSILSFSLCAKPTGSLRPDLLIGEILASKPEVSVLSITRIEQRTF